MLAPALVLAVTTPLSLSSPGAVSAPISLSSPGTALIRVPRSSPGAVPNQGSTETPGVVPDRMANSAQGPVTRNQERDPGVPPSSHVADPGATASVRITSPTVLDRVAREPEWAFSVSPFPLMYLGGTAELRHTPGPLDHYAVVSAGLSWYGKDVYDPRRADRVAIAAYATANEGLSPNLDARVGYGLNLTRNVRLYLSGRYVGSNLEASGAAWLAREQNPPGPLENPHDPDALVAHRPILLFGPHLDADFTDDPAFPTRGFSFRGALDFGPSWLGNLTKSGKPNDFGILRARASQFFPLDDDATIVLSGVGGYGFGKLPVYHRFSAGGVDYLRGYLPDRFGGDRLLVGTAEFRHLLLPGIVEMGGSFDLGLEYHAFLDAGRAWETSCDACAPNQPPIAFPADWRLGAGAGIGLTAGRGTLLRVDVAVGNEGLVYFPLFGGGLKIPLVPAFGLSLSETW